MIHLSGQLSDGQSSKLSPASLRVEDAQAVIESAGTSFVVTLEAIRVSPRMANTPRAIVLPEGRRFVTENNEAADQLEAHLGGTWANRLIHRLESRLHYVLITLICLIVFSWSFLQYGLPALSDGIARSLPPDVSQAIGSGSLKLLDKWALSPSELPPKRLQALRSKLDQVIPGDSGMHFQLVFRKGNQLGANAFAFPDGTIVMTDEIIRASRDDDELVTVMAHEVGHVVHRHGLRMLIQHSGLAFIFIAITGDVSGTSSILLTLPALLVESSYSQNFEREADDYALNYIQQHQISGEHFLNLMNRLESMPDKHRHTKDDDDDSISDALGYFSSHPPTSERAQRFQAIDSEI